MDYKKIVCCGLLFNLFPLSSVSFAEEMGSLAAQESSTEQSTFYLEATTTQQSDPDEKNNSTGSLVADDKIGDDEQGNLQFYHPIRLQDFVLVPSTTRTANKQQIFIDKIAPLARSLAQANDLYASVMIAQAIVESGWGGSTLSQYPNHNLFGIKGSYNGQSVTLPTWEYNSKDGWYMIQAKFRKYPTYKESLNDNVTILKKTSFQPGVYYYQGAWKSNTKTYKEATAYLKGRYATAPTYDTTLNQVIETYQLTQYDSNNSGNVQTNAMYRLYNPNSGEHFYTANSIERDKVKHAGWRYEGIGWQAPKKGNPVYRLYNPNAGDHHYTPHASEKNHLIKVGWHYEGISWYSGGDKPLYRLYNPNAKAGTHHYTLSKGERDQLIKRGWHNEGTGWYGQ